MIWEKIQMNPSKEALTLSGYFVKFDRSLADHVKIHSRMLI